MAGERLNLASKRASKGVKMSEFWGTTPSDSKRLKVILVMKNGEIRPIYGPQSTITGGRGAGRGVSTLTA